jgi:putative transposase
VNNSQTEETMSKTAHYYTKFDTDHYYHIYNRSVDRKPMFQNDGNYHFFLQQYDYYLSDVLDTYAYCLLGNHFHLLVRVRDLTTFQKLSNLGERNTHDIVSHQFRKFFQSYAMAFNKQQDRTGTLFQTPFKRALVDTDEYFTRLVYYIHANPQSHGLIDDFREWKWSSYDRILIEKPTKLKKQDVIDWFGGVNYYKKYHAENQQVIYDEKYILEDQ